MCRPLTRLKSRSASWSLNDLSTQWQVTPVASADVTYKRDFQRGNGLIVRYIPRYECPGLLVQQSKARLTLESLAANSIFNSVFTTEAASLSLARMTFRDGEDADFPFTLIEEMSFLKWGFSAWLKGMFPEIKKCSASSTTSVWDWGARLVELGPNFCEKNDAKEEAPLDAGGIIRLRLGQDLLIWLLRVVVLPPIVLECARMQFMHSLHRIWGTFFFKLTTSWKYWFNFPDDELCVRAGVSTYQWKLGILT